MLPEESEQEDERYSLHYSPCLLGRKTRSFLHYMLEGWTSHFSLPPNSETRNAPEVEITAHLSG
jgi:hypothetical protein